LGAGADEAGWDCVWANDPAVSIKATATDRLVRFMDVVVEKEQKVRRRRNESQKGDAITGGGSQC
jgi:hypothetical protein